MLDPKKQVLVFTIIFLGALWGSTPDLWANEKPVFASNYPLFYFASRINGNAENIYFPTIDGDPAFWMPKSQEILKIQKAKVILMNGAGYEKWANQVTLPKNRIQNTSLGFSDQTIRISNFQTHSHGPKGEHPHEGISFTTWLDFSLASLQAEGVKNALVSAKLKSKEELQKNFQALKKDLIFLDESLLALTRGNKIPLLASHPVYDYLARRYGLNIKSVTWEPDVYPTEKMWRELEHLQKIKRFSWMIWEEEPLSKTSSRLQGLGIQSIVFNPCGNRPERGDFFLVMKENISNIKVIFEPPNATVKR